MVQVISNLELCKPKNMLKVVKKYSILLFFFSDDVFLKLEKFLENTTTPFFQLVFHPDTPAVCQPAPNKKN